MGIASKPFYIECILQLPLRTAWQSYASLQSTGTRVGGPLHSRSSRSDRDQSLRTVLRQQQHPKAAQHESTTDSFIPWSSVDLCLQAKDRMSCNFHEAHQRSVVPSARSMAGTTTLIRIYTDQLLQRVCSGPTPVPSSPSADLPTSQRGAPERNGKSMASACRLQSNSGCISGCPPGWP